MRAKKSLIDRVLQRATKKSASPAWLDGSVSYYKISSRAAHALVREAFGAGKKPPRPGYEMELPESRRDGWSGNWIISNYGGKYELRWERGLAHSAYLKL